MAILGYEPITVKTNIIRLVLIDYVNNNPLLAPHPNAYYGPNPWVLVFHQYHHRIILLLHSGCVNSSLAAILAPYGLRCKDRLLKPLQNLSSLVNMAPFVYGWGVAKW